VLLCIANDPGTRLRDVASGLGITERSAHGIITGLAQADYVIKQVGLPFRSHPWIGSDCPGTCGA
jgi:DNA-binding IclR family transcriptional regulator